MEQASESKNQQSQNRAAADTATQHSEDNESALEFVDNRPETAAQLQMAEIMANSPQSKQTAQLQAKINNSPRTTPPIQRQENKTGLPDNLKSGMETLSGMSMDHVKVHYNSSKPAAVQAHAFAQGSEIHLASGQEKHLPHELGHVVQQAQGRVKPTTSVGGMSVNDDVGLEKEATGLGERALQRVGMGKAKAEPTVALSGYGAVQRFKNDILVSHELSSWKYPKGEFFPSHHKSALTTLIELCADYKAYENSDLDMVEYYTAANQWPIYLQSLKKLDHILSAALAVEELFTGQTELIKLVKRIITETKSDHTEHYASYQKSYAESSNAYMQCFQGLPTYNPVYGSWITETNFLLALDTGLLKLQFSHWWKTHTYPGRNAEIHIYIGGKWWGLAHVKYNPGKDPKTDEPSYFNFKPDPNNTLPYEQANITNSRIQLHLIGALIGK